MAPRHRLTLRPIEADPRAAAIERGAADLGLGDLREVFIADIVFIDGDLESTDRDRLHGVLVDPLLQRGNWDLPTSHAVEITLQPGVTDSGADAVRHACERLGIDINAAATGRRIRFSDDVSDELADEVISRLVANPIIERWAWGAIEPTHPGAGESESVAATIIPIRGSNKGRLAAINTSRALYLDPEEMVAIRDHFESLDRDPTDLELETLGQTWSEHCAHKTFRAIIDSTGGPEGGKQELVPLMQQLRTCTETIDAEFVKSAFVGNAGIVEFVKGTTIALKAETHNHPSAVEPFGGANTGVGGVIRDVLGIAHKPIAITDILCFGPADLPLADLPEGSLHPRRVREGVIDGVADYGNKIGLPTVAGAILYDPAYTTNPLVFAGCIGTSPSRPLHEGPNPGDRVLVLGGATGRDGIRGATFSSATMDATTGEVAGASVQIGDPIVEKLLIDVLIGAEDLYSSITDCGAGGLSSAIGEMAEGIGADVELDLVPRKYPGLEPWEVWLSEAQERMVISVPKRNVSAIVNRCKRVGVGVADIGEFTGDNMLTVRSAGTPVCQLDTTFLHDGRPQRRMKAVLPDPDAAPTSRRARSRTPQLHCWRCCRTRTLRRRPQQSTGTTMKSWAPLWFVRSLAQQATAQPTAWCSLNRSPSTASLSASASTRGLDNTTPRQWPTPSSTKQSATWSPLVLTPTRSHFLTTSRGAIRGAKARWGNWLPRSKVVAPLHTCTTPRSCRAKIR